MFKRFISWLKQEEAQDLDRHGLIPTSRLDAQLAVVVPAPGPDCAVFLEGQAVIAPASHACRNAHFVEVPYIVRSACGGTPFHQRPIAVACPARSRRVGKGHHLGAADDLYQPVLDVPGLGVRHALLHPQGHVAAQSP